MKRVRPWMLWSAAATIQLTNVVLRSESASVSLAAVAAVLATICACLDFAQERGR